MQKISDGLTRERVGLSLKWCFEYDTNLGKVRDRDSCGYNVLSDKIEREDEHKIDII